MKRVQSAAYLDFIRALPCCISGNNTTVEAAHIRFGDRRAAKRPTGMGERPDDRWAVPLSGSLHREQHSMGERAFWKKYERDPIFLALALQANAGDVEAGEQIISALSAPVKNA